MPPVIGIISALAPILEPLAYATSIATSIYGATQAGGGGDGGGTPTAATQPSGPTQQQIDQRTQAILGGRADEQALTGGSLSPYAMTLGGANLRGQVGQPGWEEAIRQLLEKIGGGSSSFSPSGLPVNLAQLTAQPGTSDFLQKIALTLG